jgi:hypothetical protein
MFKNSIIALFGATLISAAAAAQERQGGLNSASPSKTPSEIEADGRRLQAIIDKSENHFKLGELNLKDGNGSGANSRDRARECLTGLDLTRRAPLPTRAVLAPLL